MAREYAPPALVRAGLEADREIPGCTFSGVLGDKAHTYGYHRGRALVSKKDYSARLPLDNLGDPWAASALDLSFTAAQMKVVTKRLRDSALHPDDPRMAVVREFYGTIDGKTVYGLTHDSGNGYWRSSTSDPSHLWHIHISFFRAYVNDYARIRQVIDVMKGIKIEETGVSVKNVVDGFNEPLPYSGNPGSRLKEAGWGPISVKRELDYIFEMMITMNKKIDKLAEQLEPKEEETDVEPSK